MVTSMFKKKMQKSWVFFLGFVSISANYNSGLLVQAQKAATWTILHSWKGLQKRWSISTLTHLAVKAAAVIDPTFKYRYYLWSSLMQIVF